MRRRLTLAVLAVVAGTLVLTVAGSLLLVRRAGIASTESDLTSEAVALAQLLQNRTAVLTDERVLQLLRTVGSYDYLAPVGLSPEGQFTSVPAPLTVRVLDVPALQADATVAGNVGDEAFVATPVTLTARQRASLGGIPGRDLPVLIVTRRVHNPVNGAPYFLLVAAVVLGVGALVAALLARRISAPLSRAATTTQRIAEGDLAARVPVRPHDYPELRGLAEAINAMGDALTRAKGLERQFLLSVSHELRTPLTSIRGYAEALTEGMADDVPGALAVIGNEARRLERLVQDLLDLARLDASTFSLDVRRVDAGAVVGDVLDAMRPEAEHLGVELRAGPSAPGLWVDADPDRLKQALSNLVENGCKFAARRVEIGASEQEGWCEMAVADDGPGIAPEDLGHVFERHFSAGRVPARKVGSGLGLAIVAELVRSMGGTVVARPGDGGAGTRMVLRLPRRPPPGPAGPT